MAVLRVALLQMAGCGLDQEANLQKGDDFCRRARVVGADIALFPEMWNVGYTFFDRDRPGAREEWERQAIGQTDPFFTHFVGLACELGMAIGLTYLERWDGPPRNSVAIIDHHGEVALTYAKVHTCDFGDEAALDAGGDFPVCGLDTDAGPVRIGAMICYDREFPETARILMVRGAEIILVPNACTMEANRLTQLRARAYENMVGVALANHAPPEANGHSVAYDGIAFDADGSSRDMLLIEAGDREGVYLAEFDLDALRDYRARETWGNAFRRPKLYGDLTSDQVEAPFRESRSQKVDAGGGNEVGVLDRRDMLKSATLGAAYVATRPLTRGAVAMAERIARTDPPRGYDHRLGFGAWVNDMRNEALPLQQWPAPQFDDATVEGLTRTLDVMAESGYQCLDTFGWFATESYPLDIVSAFEDAERNRNIAKVFRAADKRGLRLTLPLGLMTWGYDRIIQEDPSVRGKDQEGNPHAHAMCGAQEKSWSYIEKLIDTMFARLDFGAVHLESADLGYCGCPECGGKYGGVGYNARLNARAADYIKQKHPDVLVYVCPISWIPFTLNADGVQPKIGSDDLPYIIELSRHIDLFMDQGHRGRILNWEDVPRLHCAYGTSGGLWVYHGARQDRLSYCLPYPRRAAQHLKDHYDHGTRGCLYYQGPMINPAAEVNSAVAGRVLCDPARKPEDVLEEVIEAYYRPRRVASRRELTEVIFGLEEAYFGQWQEARFKQIDKVEMPGEFCLGALFATTPDPAAFLSDWFLDAAGRAACMAGLKRALADLAAIRRDFRDEGRVERLIRSCTVMAHLLATTMSAKGEPWDS